MKSASDLSAETIRLIAKAVIAHHGCAMRRTGAQVQFNGSGSAIERLELAYKDFAARICAMADNGLLDIDDAIAATDANTTQKQIAWALENT